LQLRDLNLGTQFPTIKGLEVADSKIDADTGLLESLDLALDLHYSGNFQLSIDVKMLLGKTAYMALQGIICMIRKKNYNIGEKVSSYFLNSKLCKQYLRQKMKFKLKKILKFEISTFEKLLYPLSFCGFNFYIEKITKTEKDKKFSFHFESFTCPKIFDYLS